MQDLKKSELRGLMKRVVQVTVLLVEIGGLFLAIKLAHDGAFNLALRIFLFETIVLIVFVLTHRLIEGILDRPPRRNSARWWL
jgi:hypothetical protein